MIVTYGERYSFLAQVIGQLASAPVSHIVVVFNGNYHPELIPTSVSIVPVVLPENLGSAWGYRAGIETALKLDCDYFLFLDDDNLPVSNCIDSLFAEHLRLGSGPLLALQAFRRSQPWQRILVSQGVMPIGRPNTFGWFHAFNERHLLKRQLFGANSTGKDSAPPAHGIFRIGLAAYGGLFATRETLLLGELPDPRYFCYYDDLDFSNRLTQRGVTIFLCAGAVVDDLEASWHAQDSRVHPAFSPQTPDQKVYLDLRNAFIFYRSMTTSRVAFFINGIGFWLGIAYLALFRSADIRTTARRLKLIFHAARKGLRGEFALCPV